MKYFVVNRETWKTLLISLSDGRGARRNSVKVNKDSLAGKRKNLSPANKTNFAN